MPRKEFAIEDEVCKYARMMGWRQRKMTFVGRVGCPDRWFTRGMGQLIIIEFKDPDEGELSYSQRKECNWLLTNGFNIHIIDNVADGKAVFDAWEELHG